MTQPVQDDRLHLRVRTVEDSLGLIPHLMGFHPEESLVVLVIQAGVVEVTARVDITEIAPRGALESLLQRIWARFPSADAWFVAYTADQRSGWRLLGRCARFLPPAATFRCTLVDGDRWIADRPDGPSGHHDPRSSSLAAEATVHGLVARRSRRDLEACLVGPPAEDEGTVAELAASALSELAGVKPRRRPELMAGVLARHAPGDAVDDTMAARLAVFVLDPDARAVAMLAMSRADARHHLELWLGVLHRASSISRRHVLGLIALASWLAGEGALSNMCLEQAAQQQLESGLLNIVSEVMDGVVPPSSWDEMRPSMIDESPLRVRRALSRPVFRQGR